jgi:hypothetical protein
MKLRVDYINEDMTPRDLRGLFESLGSVNEVAIYAGRDLIYGVVDMTEKHADRALATGTYLHWQGRQLRIEVANRSRRRWLSPDWRPPRQDRYR